jgi:hypothetical protein
MWTIPRAVSACVAVTEVVGIVAVRGIVGALPSLFFCLIAMTFIWFPEIPVYWQSRGSSEECPPQIIRILGWIFLLLPPIMATSPPYWLHR